VDKFIRSQIHIKEREFLGQWYEVTGTFLFLVQGESMGRRCGEKSANEKERSNFAVN
jgi:hypothetical protein